MEKNNKNRQNLTLKGLGSFAALARFAPEQAPKGLKSAGDLTPLLAFGLAACGGGGGSSSSSPPSNPPPPLVLPDDVPLALYENHPTNKAVYDATPQGQSAAEIDLPADTADNNLFRLSDDGRIWWSASPDYEAETDSDGDGVYIIRINHPHNAQGHTEIEVTVQDVEREISFEQRENGENNATIYNFRFEDVEAVLPENEFVQHILAGRIFSMPEQGTLILTWSLATPNSPDYGGEIPRGEVTKTQQAIDKYRENIVRALSEFERHTNIKFAEVLESDNSIGDIRFNILKNNSRGQAGLGSHSFVNLGEDAPYRAYVHEIGHALGLTHPHLSGTTNPGFNIVDDRYVGDRRSIMANLTNLESLRPTDIEALQFLYGDENNPELNGVQAALAEI